MLGAALAACALATLDARAQLADYVVAGDRIEQQIAALAKMSDGSVWSAT